MNTVDRFYSMREWIADCVHALSVEIALSHVTLDVLRVSYFVTISLKPKQNVQPLVNVYTLDLEISPLFAVANSPVRYTHAVHCNNASEVLNLPNLVKCPAKAQAVTCFWEGLPVFILIIWRLYQSIDDKCFSHFVEEIEKSFWNYVGIL